MHILGQITCKDQSSASLRMKESEEAGMEGLAVQDRKRVSGPGSRFRRQTGQTTPSASVVRIAEHRVAQMLPVGADLMGPAGLQPEVHRRPRLAWPQDAIMGYRLSSPSGYDLHPAPIRPAAGQSLADTTFGRGDPPP